MISPVSWTARVLVQVLALHDDAVRRSLEGLDVVQGDPHVLEPQRLQGLEAEDVADDRRGEVGDRALLEQVDLVGDVRHVLVLASRDLVDPVALRLVLLVSGQTVGPDDRPRRRGGLTRDGRAGLVGGHPRLGRDPERRQDVGVVRLVAGLPVAHLGVLQDP